jgi:hypothetical protein
MMDGAVQLAAGFAARLGSFCKLVSGSFCVCFFREDRKDVEQRLGSCRGMALFGAIPHFSVPYFATKVSLWWQNMCRESHRNNKCYLKRKSEQNEKSNVRIYVRNCTHQRVQTPFHG